MTGVVTSASLQRPVQGARVTIDQSSIQATTDQDGRYVLTGVTAGTHTLRIDEPGYAPFTIDIVASDDQAIAANGVLTLADAEGAGDIVVTGSRASRVLSIERKRALATISDVVSSDGIGKLPDYNTAEALQRLPGVSVEIDQGEPRYVVVRGIDPNLNQVMVDGNLVGIPEAEGRRVALDTIPSDLVASIEVVKAVTPDYDANAIGGSINIVTPTAFDQTPPFTFASVRGSYNDKSGKTGFGGSATHGQKFGPDEQFGIVVAGSYSKRFIDSDSAEPTNWTAFTTNGTRVTAPTNYTLYDYRIMRERIGGIVNLDWRPSDQTRVYVRTIYDEFTDHEERDQFNFALVNSAPAPTVLNRTSIRFPNGRATRQFRQNDQTQKLYNVSPGAELKFGQFELDLNYTYAHAQEHTPIRDDLEFRSAANQTATLDLSSDRPLFSAIDPRLSDPNAFPLRRIRERREQIDEDLNTVRADLKYNFGDNEASFIKIGGKFIDRVKDRDNSQTQRDAVPTAPSSPGSIGQALPTPDDFYNGDYAFGPAINYQGVLDYYAAHPNLIALNAGQTAINDKSLDYHIHEKIYAGYAMASLTFGDLNAIGGVRVERTEGRYDAFQLRTTTGITPLSFDNKYTHVLPSVHLNYRPRRDFTLRAAWTNTIGRPNYDASVPSFTEEAGAGTAGNPDLKPYTSMGLDVSAEYYPDAESIFSVGAFYKHLKNPVFTQTILNTSFAGVPLLSLSQPQNADSGKLYGIEANAQRRLTFLPAPLDGFGISANATYVTSNVKVPGRESEDIPFFGQSNWIANAALFYEKGPFEARVAVAYRTAFIANVGNATQKTAADIYEAGRTSLDARMSYKVTKGIELFGALSNITNAPLSYYQTTRDQTYARQIYSFNGDFGVSVRF
ncbi:TonB-dependent receptor [Sphingomonas endolithica]|uniref:TonB-dependent receptor n=1 Tax=Sphingomonas endolithica TaxID=2972485 RepID=UPI003AAFB6F2